MVKIRHAITLACLIVFSVISVVAAVQTARTGLPETPSVEGAAVLIGHLSEISLAKDLPQEKRLMARRVMRELRDDVDWQPDVSALSTAQQKQLLENLTELAQEVISSKMEIYFKLKSKREQQRFLDRQFEEITRWAVVVDRVTKVPGQSSIRMTAMMTLMARLNKWYTEASPEKRKELQEFQKAFQERLRDRGLRGLQPGA